MGREHRSVLMTETLEVLQPQSSRKILDATFGRGGHSRELLVAGATVVALDQDPDAIEAASPLVEEFGADRFEIRKMNFRDLQKVVDAGERYDGVLFDLGVSSPQLDRGERGFSFQHDGPLDMRMDPESSLTAAGLVNRGSEQELAQIFFEFGEERGSRRVAAAIARAREAGEISTTHQLADIISQALGGRRDRKIHPATKCFQALRIKVNEELTALDEALEAVPSLLNAGGRMATISFHALEDRRVKRFIEKHSEEEIRGEHYAFGQPNPDFCMKKLGRWKPSDQEIQENPRARSARLRGAEKI
ncbi:MAG: 16S rRNA (cytosine(1402)-N(4))-methyltransferase RsmH [Verrucomicrobiota bacterium]